MCADIYTMDNTEETEDLGRGAVGNHRNNRNLKSSENIAIDEYMQEVMLEEQEGME